MLPFTLTLLLQVAPMPVHTESVSLTLGDTPVRAAVHTVEGGALRMVNVHDDENTSVEAGLEVLARHGGRLVELVHQNVRHVAFAVGGKKHQLDPNRMFTDVGAAHDLGLDKQLAAPPVKAVRAFAEAFLKQVDPVPGEVLVALHNNSPDPSFSVLAYQPGGLYGREASRVFQAKGRHVDDFFFVTEPALFEALAKRDFNVVLQDNTHVTDDGSLSVRCARDGVRYVNVEAQHGHKAEQVEMLEALLEVLASR